MCVKIDVLASGTLVEADCRPIGQKKPFLTLRTVEIGAFKALCAFKCAAVAVHRIVGHIQQLEVVEFRTVAGVVGHVGNVAVDAGVDASVVEEIGLVSA